MNKFGVFQKTQREPPATHRTSTSVESTTFDAQEAEYMSTRQFHWMNKMLETYAAVRIGGGHFKMDEVMLMDAQRKFS